MYKTLYLSVITIVIFAGLSFAGNTGNKFFVEISATNLIEAISEETMQQSSFMPGVSVGYKRLNSDKVSSYVGLQFIPGVDRTNLMSLRQSASDAQDYTEISDFYGISMLYGVSRFFGNLSMGLHSNYHLEFSESDLIAGVRVAYTYGFKDISLGINCFYGYADIINFLDNFSLGRDAVDMNKFVYNIGLTIDASIEGPSD